MKARHANDSGFRETQNAQRDVPTRAFCPRKEVTYDISGRIRTTKDENSSCGRGFIIYLSACIIISYIAFEKVACRTSTNSGPRGRKFKSCHPDFVWEKCGKLYIAYLYNRIVMLNRFRALSCSIE